MQAAVTKHEVIAHSVEQPVSLLAKWNLPETIDPVLPCDNESVAPYRGLLKCIHGGLRRADLHARTGLLHRWVSDLTRFTADTYQVTAIHDFGHNQLRT